MHLADGVGDTINLPVRYHLLKIFYRINTSDLFDGIVLAVIFAFLESGCLLFSHLSIEWLILHPLSILSFFCLNSLLFFIDNVSPVDSLLLLLCTLLIFFGNDNWEGIVEFLYFFLSLLLDLLIGLEVTLNGFVPLWKLSCCLWMGNFMTDNLIKVLNRWIECFLWLKFLIDKHFIIRVSVLLAQVKLFNKFCGSLSLFIGCWDQRRKLIVSQVLCSWYLGQIQQGLLLANMRIQNHKFWFSIFPLDDLGKQHLARFDH